MTEQACIIRAYNADDQTACLDIWLRASQVGHPFLTEADLARQHHLVSEMYLPRAETWVAAVDGQIKGFIGLLGSHVGGLFVDPSIHGGGIGRMLLRHAAMLKGELTVEVYEANRAVGFYQRCGFQITGRRDQDDEGRNLPLLLMRWKTADVPVRQLTYES